MHDTAILKFGIDTILRADFRVANPTRSPLATSPLCAATSPNSVVSSSASSVSPTFAAASAIDNRAVFPAWVFCTRYSDRPSAGPRNRKTRKRESTGSSGSEEEKRPRTAFTSEQLNRLKEQFRDNRYLTEKRRQELAHELGLHEAQIKIWFQNKRAKLKKANGDRAPVGTTPLSFQVMAQLAQVQAHTNRP